MPQGDIHDPEFEKRYLAGLERARQVTKSLEGQSPVEMLGACSDDALRELFSEMSRSQIASLLYNWGFWARPKQDPDLREIIHRVLFLLGGRGSGKTVSGANRVRRRVEAGARSMAIVGPTLREIERYQIKGDGGSDGLLTVFPPYLVPEWKPNKQIMFFHRPECGGCGNPESCGGAVAYINSAEDPEFRGPNLDTVWLDEPAKFRYLQTIWANIELATRLRGQVPLEIILTGTPRPLRLFRELIADEETVTVLMHQDDNATNLDSAYLARMRRKYDGTRIGRQERAGEILTDNPDALFQSSILDATRVEFAPPLEEIAVAVDPAIATNPENDETGILAGGRGAGGHIFILADASGRSKPEKWGNDVISTCTQWQTDIVIGERNRGGDLVAANVRAAKARKSGELAAKALKVVEVHATRGKLIRAEPVSALHEKGMIHIVGRMPEFEAEITEWNPKIGGVSPNRLDALVWLVWYLARLGEEEEIDYRAGFTGVEAAAKALRSAAAAGFSGLGAALPAAQWGSKL